ncbi:MAG: DEAD/DEAH box helicase [Acidimicrobiia bacterium]
MTSSFARLGLPEPLVRALANGGIDEPFPIQEATIPACLAGDDVCGMAPTGSGKTLAFGLPMLSNVGRAGRRRPRALVLAPTRELAEQINKELAPLARVVGRNIAAIYGGTSYGPQRNALNRGVDVVVATPGRLEDLIEQGAVDLGEVDIVVVDEADRLADMGFLPAVRRILDKTSTQRQTMLFSATLDGDVAVLVRDYQRNPARFESENTEDAAEVRHHFWLVDHHDRIRHTAKVIETMGRSLVFTRTRHGADRLARQLAKTGIGAVAMHGGRSQGQRNRALKAFSSGNVQALVATDVAARGIHIDAVEVVIHYDPAGDHKDFLHRSGRTGRAGAAGTVVSLVTREHRRAVGHIQKSLRLSQQIIEPNIKDLRVAPSTPKQGPPKNHRSPGSTAPTPNRPSSQVPAGTTRSLYVGNLPWRTTADDLDRVFGRHGQVIRSTIATRKGRSKGYGFVEMNDDSAHRAIDALNTTDLDGRKLVVRSAR